MKKINSKNLSAMLYFHKKKNFELKMYYIEHILPKSKSAKMNI